MPFNSYDKINTVATQSNGKIVIGGNFNYFQSFSPYDSVRNILRLNSDGTTDFSFNAYSSFYQNYFEIKSIIIDPIGKILIAGDFSRSIMRLNDDGTKDLSFNVGLGFDYTSNIKLTKYGVKTIVTGEFTQYNNYPIENIAILDTLGQLETTFNMGSGINLFIPLVVLPNGNFLISLSDYSSLFELYEIGRFGQIVKSQLYTIDFQANNMNQDLIVLKSGKILVIDAFRRLNGHQTNYIARVNWDKNLIFNDYNSNCSEDNFENPISGNLPVIIQPGNYIYNTHNGFMNLDSLPIGTYTATVDTSGQWKATCSPSVTFTVVHPDSFVHVTPIGMYNTKPCTATGIVFNDLNSNCIKDALELQNNSHLTLLIQPGNIVTQIINGIWRVDSLPYGNYTATIDTSGQWKSACPTISFSFTTQNSFIQNLNFGLINNNPCTEPNISITAPKKMFI